MYLYLGSDKMAVINERVIKTIRDIVEKDQDEYGADEILCKIEGVLKSYDMLFEEDIKED